MIYQSVSIQPVIARVIRNTKIQDTTYIMDMDEWIPEAMGLMHTRTTLSSKGPVPVEIVFHKGKLPCDLYHLVAVRYCGKRLVEGNSINKMVKDTGTIPYYNIEMGFITTSFQDGSADIFYAAQPVDIDGLPLIPDNEDYKEALAYYCRAKMVGCGYKDPVFSEQVLMERFEKHAARAIGAIRYPSVDSMEQKVTTMVNFIPPQNYFDNFFRVDADEPVYGIGGASSPLPAIITSTGTGVPVDLNPEDPEPQWTVKQF